MVHVCDIGRKITCTRDRLYPAPLYTCRLYDDENYEIRRYEDCGNYHVGDELEKFATAT